jgi:4-amino-4-deoxy-L-arabinose transferase-like glycosyltransferase
MRVVRPRRQTLVVIGGLALIAVVFLSVSASNPPGFFRDESAIAYNAHTLATSGKDEYGARLPVFIRSFGDYKSPLYVYLLAGVFRVTGLSTGVARSFSAVLGLAAVLVLYALALAISRKPMLALAVAMIAGLSPWLFETTRLVFEVALMPLLIALLLLAVYRASAGPWRLRHSVSIGLLLAAIAYTYQAGRVLAPLFAIGLVLFWARARWRQLAATWAVFLAAVLPIGVWALIHPGTLEARYHATTYIHQGMSRWELVRQFLVHYAKNMNLWAWLAHGDANVVHHVQGAGSLFFVEVALALVGTAVVLLRRRSDPWWRFVLFGVLASPVAASATAETLNSLRMIALPVFLPVLALPALELLAALPRPGPRTAIATAVTIVFAVEAVHWQVVFRRHGGARVSAFEAQAHSVVDAAFRHGGTVYAFRTAHGPYVDLLLYGTIAGRSRSSTVVLDGPRPAAGALFVGSVGECPQCPALEERGAFGIYTYKPAPAGVLRTSFQLNSPLLPVGSPLQFLVEVDNHGAQLADHIVLTVKLPAGMALGAPPYHQLGLCRSDSSTIVCNLGYLPAKSSTLVRYVAQVTEGGPLTTTASLNSDKLTVNPAGTGSAFTVDLSPPAYAKSSPGQGSR